jgi:hypothetical protein
MVGFRSSPAIEWCCAISAVDFYYTVAVDIKILLMDGCDERWMENRREQTGEDLDPIWLTIHTHILRFFTILIVT